MNLNIFRGEKGSFSYGRIPTNRCQGNDEIRTYYSVTTTVVVNSDWNH